MFKTILASILFLAIPQAEEKQGAAEFLAAVESLYLGADTLQWKGTFKIERVTPEGSNEVGSAEVEAAFKKANRVRVQLKAKEGGSEIRSDGIALLFNPGRRPHRGATPKSLDANVRIILIRAGVEMASLSRAIRQDLDLETVTKRLSLSEIRWGKVDKIEGKDIKTVEYVLSAVVDDSKSEYKVKLWVDPKTHHVLRRVMENPAQGLRITETYSSISINAKLEDTHFAVPIEDKK